MTPKVKAQFQREYKLVVLGLPGVGKSSLTIQFVQNRFIDLYDPCIEYAFQKQILIEDEVVLVEILDTAGQEDYCIFWMGMSNRSMDNSYPLLGEGFLLVYSIADRDSFNVIGPLYEQLLRVRKQEIGTVPVIVVGNKCDLEDQPQVAANGIFITPYRMAEGRDLAKHFGCEFREASAKSGLNVDEIFINLVLNIRRHNKVQTTNSLNHMEALSEPLKLEESQTTGCCKSCVVL